jgi:hypothetical protein
VFSYNSHASKATALTLGAVLPVMEPVLSCLAV